MAIENNIFTPKKKKQLKVYSWPIDVRCLGRNEEAKAHSRELRRKKRKRKAKKGF